jgi:hypothetical protein
MLRFGILLLVPAVLVAMGSTGKAQATRVIVIDLATQDEGSELVQPLSIETEENVSVLIKNRLTFPDHRYNVEIKLENLTIPPLPISSLGGFGEVLKVKVQPPTITRPDSECNDRCLAILEEIKKASSEKLLPSLKNKFSAELGDKCKGKSDVIAFYVSVAESLTSYEPVDNITVKRGQEMTVVITRSSGDKELKWTNIYRTGPRGHWIFSYGFSFPYLANEERDYFTKADSDTSYTITKKNAVGKVKYIPAVYIHWFPTRDELKDWSCSVVGGIGFDLENPVVFIGGSVTYNQNLSFMLGGMLHQVNDLDGRYHENEKVKENLESAQLLVQKWVLNPCFTISFRFDNDPFK